MRRAYLIALLLLAAAGSLGIGLTVPVLRFTAWFFEDDQSIVDTVWVFLSGEDVFLGLVIGLFSILLPIVKLVLLTLTHLRSFAVPTRVLGGVAVLGKWSMLDVFVVFATLGCVQLGVLGETEVRPGVYWYTTSVLLSMIVAAALLPVTIPRPSKPARGLKLIAAGLFVAGLWLPLMQVEKWWFWEQEFSLVSVLPAMWMAGEWLLPLVLGVLVIAVPAVSFAAGVIGWVPRALVTRIGCKWGMLDVFVVGMLLVWFKVRDQAEVALLSGFWLLAAAVVLSWLSQLFRTEDRSAIGGELVSKAKAWSGRFDGSLPIKRLQQ